MRFLQSSLGGCSNHQTLYWGKHYWENIVTPSASWIVLSRAQLLMDGEGFWLVE
uniref:Uncharacterized protein n=1 Tax=Brassica oleracea var. oleracea TaxID=109376 RepID=A0A0D3AGG7_BRAOL